MGELWAGAGGMECEQEGGCTKTSNIVYLTQEEVAMLNASFPDDVLDGLARGPSAARAILQGSLGKVYCDEHAPPSA